MDDGGAGQIVANINGDQHQHFVEDDEDQNQLQLSSGGIVDDTYDNVDDSAGGIEIKRSIDDGSNRDSSAGLVKFVSSLV